MDTNSKNKKKKDLKKENPLLKLVNHWQRGN